MGDGILARPQDDAMPKSLSRMIENLDNLFIYIYIYILDRIMYNIYIYIRIYIYVHHVHNFIYKVQVFYFSIDLEKVAIPRTRHTAPLEPLTRHWRAVPARAALVRDGFLGSSCGFHQWYLNGIYRDLMGFYSDPMGY